MYIVAPPPFFFEAHKKIVLYHVDFPLARRNSRLLRAVTGIYAQCLVVGPAGQCPGQCYSDYMLRLTHSAHDMR